MIKNNPGLFILGLDMIIKSILNIHFVIESVYEGAFFTFYRV